MHANNETGSLQPVAEAEVDRAAGLLVGRAAAAPPRRCPV
jgi:hypothetical protein